MKKTVFILSTLLAFNANAANDWTDCGTDANGDIANCQYKISTDGTLTIKANEGNNGNIGFWDQREGTIAPWRSSTVTNVVIEESIKDLGTYGFHGITSQNPIVIPSNVSSLDTSAFQFIHTPEIIISDSVTSIGSTAFAWSRCQKIDIPNSVKTIGNEAFRGMLYLTDLVIPDSVESIAEGALGYCPRLKTLTIGENTQLETIFASASTDTIFTDLANLKIYCTGDTAKCNANLAAAGYNDLATIAATTKKINGVTYVYDNKGKLVTTSGNRIEKRIYTIDEANAVAGEKNRVSIKYR